jgi:hypothetical protein
MLEVRMPGVARYTGDITVGERALGLFTDRHAAIRHFSSYLNDDPPKPTILFFHGVGGNGKTLLLRYLEKSCCKRLSPDNWAYVSALDDDEFVANRIRITAGHDLFVRRYPSRCGRAAHRRRKGSGDLKPSRCEEA